MASDSEALARASLRSGDGTFAAWSARRLLIIGGIGLIALGMIFGDIFAVFILHQNAARISEALLAATHAIGAQDAHGVLDHFSAIGRFLEHRGTKVDAHAHMITFGYLALLLALIQPYVALDERRKKRMAVLFLIGAIVLPVSVFLIYYVGLAYSPLETIGWASILADFGGLLVIIACLDQLIGLWRYVRRRRLGEARATSLLEWSWSSRALLVGGTLLVLLGFLYGGYYAAVDLYAHEEGEVTTLRTIIERAAANEMTEAERAVDAYGLLQADQAVKIAAHAHIIEFGLLAMLLAFVQPYVFLSQRWRRRWVVVLLIGSVVLPVFVFLEIEWGLVAGGIADVGGLLIIIALLGMLVGVLRHTGRLDAEGEEVR